MEVTPRNVVALSIRPEDLAIVREARLRAELAARDLEVVQLKIFLQYQMSAADSFDIATGKITVAPRQDDRGTEAEWQRMCAAHAATSEKADG